MNTKSIVLAGGCFWGMQDLIRKLPGVLSTRVGYTGGTNENPTYESHPGHAEVLEISYDVDVISLEQILDHFFQLHDPTTLNRQGNDIGSSYRSAIFVNSDEEKSIAQHMIDLVNADGRWNAPVVTSIEPLTKFWPAEEYHQDYLIKNPDGYTCHFVRPGGSYLAKK